MKKKIFSRWLAIFWPPAMVFCLHCALPIFEPYDSFASQLDRTLRGQVKSYSIAVLDLESGFSYAVRQSRVYPAASTMKAAILLAAHGLAARGIIDLDRRIPVINEFVSVADGSSYQVPDEVSRRCTCLAWRNQGGQLKIRDLLRDMIRNSSNLATNLLIQELGARRIMEELEDQGIRGISISRGLYDLPAFAKNWHNTLTARGTLQIFYNIYYYKALPLKSRQEMIEVLAATIHRDRLPALLPSGVFVAQKAGLTDDVSHDAGMVFPDQKKPYFVAILTEGYRTRTGSGQAIAHVSRIIYDQVVARRAKKKRD